MTKSSEKEPERKLPPVIGKTYEATVKGWRAFLKDANIFYRAEYVLQGTPSPLGEKSFGAVWVTKGEQAEYSDPFGVNDEEDFPLSDDHGWINLR